MNLERRISFPRAAFEKRHDDPHRDYGIGCVMAEFTVIGSDGAVAFEVFTGWFLPHVRERLRRETRHHQFRQGGPWMRCVLEGHGGVVSFHSLVPTYEGHEAVECDLLPGGRCYADNAFMLGETLFDALVEGGEDGLWAAMESAYRDGLQRTGTAASGGDRG